jgi:hypothetical protein
MTVTFLIRAQFNSLLLHLLKTTDCQSKAHIFNKSSRPEKSPNDYEEQLLENMLDITQFTL